MGTLPPHETKVPWYRLDLIRDCKTGETIEPMPRSLAQRLRMVVGTLAVAVPLVIGSQWFLESCTLHHIAGVDALAKGDSVEQLSELVQIRSLLLLLMSVLAVVVSVNPVVETAIRVARAGRWPLPGADVRRRTGVVAGWYVRLPALLLAVVALACMFVAWRHFVERVAAT